MISKADNIDAPFLNFLLDGGGKTKWERDPEFDWEYAVLENEQQRYLNGLYVIVNKNPFNLPKGAFFKRFDDGFERCEVTTENHRLQVTGYVGLIYPAQALAPFLQKIQKVGLDQGTMRHWRRKKFDD